MSELRGTLIVAQSGGPTAVINSSVYGVVRTALDAECITKVYGAHHGIKGVLNDQLITFDLEDDKELERLQYTPSSVLGSCRYKLADSEVDDTDYKRILQIFKKYNVRYFCYNGGNDSMDTCNKISKYMKKVGYECRVMGVPKTIDNDLTGTDHCPGYASAAKYIATSMMEVARDAKVYDSGCVTVIECMGRHAGWITAAAALANIKDRCIDYIYLPEVAFDMDQFLNDVEHTYKTRGDCIAVVSEGLRYADGRFVSEAEASATDGFGHAQLGGLAAKLTSAVADRLGCKVRPIELSLLQRCAAHCASLTDINESRMSGEVAVKAMLEGDSDKMVGFKCERKNGYTCEPVLLPLEAVANDEKKFPLDWITDEKNNILPAFVDYALPLIQGETKLEYEDGLPRFAILKRIYS